MAVVPAFLFDIFGSQIKASVLQKALGIFLVLLIVSPLQWAFWSFKVQKKIVKREVKHRMIDGIDSTELTELRFSKSQTITQLRWEHAKEFEYRGEMYDVVKKTETADSVVYVCWWDHAETCLNKKLNTLVTLAIKNKPESKSRNELVVRFLTLIYQQPQQVSIDVFPIGKTPFHTSCNSKLLEYTSSFFIPPEK